MRCHLWFLSNDGSINIANSITIFFQKLRYMDQQFYTGNSLISRICIRKMLSDISQCSSTQKGIHDCVNQYIRI